MVTLRTDSTYKRHVNKAEKSRKKHYKGVKGSTLLAQCSFYSVSSSVQIDLMHTVGLGVIKNLFEYWFDFKLGEYSLRYYYDEIEKRYVSIRPPNHLSSAPKSITEWKNWKAREFINFILFYSLPVFLNLMPIAHFEHLTKLVTALEILRTKNIQVSSIQVADNLLRQFVEGASSLYTPSIMKSGVHELLHLAKCTIDIGPLNTISCFPFEEMNRKLIRFIKGRDLMGEEFFKLFSVLQTLISFSSQYNFQNTQLKEFIVKKSNIKTSNRKDRYNSEEDFKVSIKISNFDDINLINFIEQNNLTDLTLYERINYKGTSFAVRSKHNKFNNSCIEFQGTFGIIETVFVKDEVPFAVCREVNNLSSFFFDKQYLQNKISCFFCDISDDDFFICPLKKMKKVFLIEIDDTATYVNFFQSSHLFT